MRMRQLYYFMEVANSNSINSAAENLYISPQSLSESIFSLENELDTQFFIRSNKGMELTKEGIVFLKEAKNIIASYEKALTVLANYKKQQGTHTLLRVCINNGISITTFPDILKSYVSTNPSHKIKVYEVESSKVFEEVAHDRADIGITFISPKLLKKPPIKEYLNTKVDFIELSQQEFYAVTSAKSLLAQKGPLVSMEDILEYPIITDIYNSMEKFLISYKYQEYKIALATNFLETIVQVLENKFAVALIPTNVIENYHNPKLIRLKIKNGPKTNIGIIVQKTTRHFPLLKDFSSLIQNIYLQKKEA